MTPTHHIRAVICALGIMAVSITASCFVYDLPTTLLISSILLCIFYCLSSAYRHAHNNISITRSIANDPLLLTKKRQNIITHLSALEATRSLQSTVFDASTDLVGITDEKDALIRFQATLNIYWSGKHIDLFIWERGVWTSIGGDACGEDPSITAPIHVPDEEQPDLILDLSPGVDGQAVLILRDACRQPIISNRSTADQQYIAEVLRGQLALSLRRIKLYQHLRELGRTDPLTTLYRRWYGVKRLDELIHNKQLVSVAMVDIDYFKKVNDTFGHQAGDTVLHAIGSSLNTLLRTGDICCRYGGEEFLVLLPSTSSHAAQDICQRIRSHIASLSDLPCAITVSIGVSSSVDNDTSENIIHRADTALYNAKERGRNQVMLADYP